jgi:hypothetical protein
MGLKNFRLAIARHERSEIVGDGIEGKGGKKLGWGGVG